jgi:hypothetical protein
MTDDQMQNVRDDIAFMRALAAEGQRTPLLGGAIMAAAGLIFAVASVVYWASLTGLVHMDRGWGSAIIWLGALGVFFVSLAVISRGVRGKPGAGSPSNRASKAALMAVGFSIFAMGMSYSLAGIRMHSAEVMSTFPSVIFALYGAGWAVAAAMTGKAWLWWVAIGSWAMAPLLGWFAASDDQYLVYAGGLLLLAFLPGLALMRQEPSDIV